MKCLQQVAKQPKSKPVTYGNLFVFAPHKAIHEQEELGVNSFKLAKRTQPLKKLMHRKLENTDPIRANKKFFRANPNLCDFAKPLSGNAESTLGNHS